MRLGLAAALCAFAASCYHTTLQLDAGGGPLQPDAAAADAPLPTGGFISADVDGVTIRAEMQAVSYWWSGIQEGWIGAEAQNGEWQWNLVVRNAPGPTACLGGGYVGLQPVDAPAMGYGTFGTDGACAAELTAAAPSVGDVLEGTFTGTLDQLSGPGVKQVTNGAFRVPRIAGQP
jgi:hypothetical protein